METLKREHDELTHPELLEILMAIAGDVELPDFEQFKIAIVATRRVEKEPTTFSGSMKETPSTFGRPQ